MSYISHYPMEKLLESRVRASVRVIQKTFQTNQRRKDGFKLNSFHRFTRRMILGRIMPSSSLLLSPTIFTKVSALSAALRHFRPFKAPFPFPLPRLWYICIPNWERKSSTHGNTSYEWKVPYHCGSGRRTELYIQLSLRQAKSDIFRLLSLFAQNLNWAV